MRVMISIIPISSPVSPSWNRVRTVFSSAGMILSRLWDKLLMKTAQMRVEFEFPSFISYQNGCLLSTVFSKKRQKYSKKAPTQKAVGAYKFYSVLSATTGSFFDALLEGMMPATRVRITLMPIRSKATSIGSSVLRFSIPVRALRIRSTTKQSR